MTGQPEVDQAFIMRDRSLREIARLVHRSPNTLRKVWDEIPTCYRSGSRYVGTLYGYMRWQESRAQKRAGGRTGA